MKISVQFNLDTSMHPCDKVKRALEGYSDLTHGITQYGQSLGDSKTSIDELSEANKGKLEIFRREIEEHGKSTIFRLFSTPQSFLLCLVYTSGYSPMFTL